MNNPDLQDIRRLLDNYYNGSATPREEAVLADFFASAHDLPADLETEARLFRALSAHPQSYDIPDGLAERLTLAIDRAEQQEQARHPRRIAFIWRAATVAAVLAIGLIMAYQLKDNTQSSTPIAMQQPAVSPTAKPDIAATTAPETTNAPQPTAKAKVKARRTAPIAQKPNCTIIDDPVEAADYLEQVATLLERTFSEPNRRVAKVLDNIDDPNERIEETLCKITSSDRLLARTLNAVSESTDKSIANVNEILNNE